MITSFYIIGAPKAGTDSFRNFLNSHPNIYVYGPGEGNYLCTDILVKPRSIRAKLKHGLNVSLKHLTSKSPLIIGEKSTWYLASRVAGQKISNNKNSKVIILTRERFPLVKSLHNELSKLSVEKLPLDLAWQNALEHDNRLDFNNKIIGNYNKSCLIGHYIDFYLNIFDHSRTLILDIKKLSHPSNKNVIFRFLGVSSVELLPLSVANKSIKLKGSSNLGEDRENSALKSIMDYFSSDIELEHRLTSENQAYHGIV